MKPALTLLAIVATLLAAGCPQPVVRYDVTMTVVDDCVIRSNGRFCDEPERLPAPWNTSVGVERIEPEADEDPSYTMVYFDNDVWTADGVEEDRRVLKETRTIRNGCTVTVTEELRFTEDGANFNGRLTIQNRTTGPDSCGDTPFGTFREISIVSLVDNTDELTGEEAAQ